MHWEQRISLSFFFFLGRSSVHSSYIKATSPGSKLGPRWWQDVGLALSSPLLSSPTPFFFTLPYSFALFLSLPLYFYFVFTLHPWLVMIQVLHQNVVGTPLLFCWNEWYEWNLSFHSENNNSRSQCHCIDSHWTKSRIGIYCRSSKAFQVSASAKKHREKVWRTRAAISDSDRPFMFFF